MVELTVDVAGRHSYLEAFGPSLALFCWWKFAERASLDRVSVRSAAGLETAIVSVPSSPDFYDLPSDEILSPAPYLYPDEIPDPLDETRVPVHHLGEIPAPFHHHGEILALFQPHVETHVPFLPPCEYLAPFLPLYESPVHVHDFETAVCVLLCVPPSGPLFELVRDLVSARDLASARVLSTADLFLDLLDGLDLDSIFHDHDRDSIFRVLYSI